MQLKLFDYKQVEEPEQPELQFRHTAQQPEKKCCSPFRKFVCFLLALALLLAGFIAVQEIFFTGDNDYDDYDPFLFEDEPCDAVKSCLVDYYSLWDIDVKGKLPPYVEFFHKLQSNFDNLQEFAIDLICLAQEDVKACLDDNIDDISCLSVKGYREMFGLEKLDAREYAADLRVREFECANQQFLKDNFNCLYGTAQDRKEELNLCSAALRKALEDKQEPCEAMDTYISCSRDVFSGACGNEVDSFVCNLIETSMGFNYPTCKPVFQTCA